MTIIEQGTFFDYTALDAEARIVVQQRTGEIKTLMRRAAQDIIDIGQKLIEVKAMLGHGRFGPWLEAEFDWSEPTAQRFMRVCGAFQKRQIDGFAPSALYLLAAPSTPEAAREEALNRAEAGERITHQKAKDLIEEARSSKDEDEEEATEPQAAFDDKPEDKEDDEPLDAYEEAIAAQYQAKQAEQPRAVLTSQESTEWYTPAWCIKAVREALGTIDLDPASTPLANRIVQANWIYTEELDGLSQPWKATTVFVNPPYNGDAAAWCRKAATEYREGRSKAVILLVFAKLGYQWFEELFDAAPTCLVRRRISFVRPDGCDAGEAKHGSAFVYFGPEPERFRAAFASVGRVILPTEGR
jgi:phage N-6-adenine-methyltransferase